LSALEKCGEVGRRILKAKPISRLFKEEHATKVMLQFLKDIDIGKCSNDISL
jgi:hypothetical protein